MIDTTVSYKKTLPPHIHSRDSLTNRFWGQWLALFPVFAAVCLTGHAEILRILSICLVSAIAFEVLSTKILNKGEKIKNGETVLTASLFALLMPSRCPSEVLILGIFIMIVFGKELLGGTGAYPLHPVLLSRAFLQVSFPRIMNEPLFLAGSGSLWILAAIGLGGVLLVKQKQGYWETPVLFIFVSLLWEMLPGGSELTAPFFSGVLLTAFFLLADPVAMPLTRKGTRIFVVGAALLSGCLVPGGFSIRAAAYAVLLTNLLTPWLDLWLRPVPYKTSKLIKATYPV